MLDRVWRAASDANHAQANAVDDVPLLRAAARPGAAAGLKTSSSGSLAVACPDMPRRSAPPYTLSHLHLALFLDIDAGSWQPQAQKSFGVGGDVCRVAPIKELLWRMRWHSTSLALCFAVTIAVFPSITASICSVHNPARRPPCLPHTPYGRLAGVSLPPAAHAWLRVLAVLLNT